MGNYPNSSEMKLVRFARIIETKGTCEDCGKSHTHKRLQIHHLDKSKDNHSPENLRLVCPACHKRYHLPEGSLMLTHKGQTKTLYRWSLITGINESTLYQRLQRGWSVDKTLGTTPYRRQYRIDLSPKEKTPNIVVPDSGKKDKRGMAKLIEQDADRLLTTYTVNGMEAIDKEYNRVCENKQLSPLQKIAIAHKFWQALTNP